MIFCVDIGNTTLSMGFYENDKLVHKNFLLTKMCFDYEKLKDQLLLIFREFELDVFDISGVIISSVVLEINPVIDRVFKELFKCRIIHLDEVNDGIKIGLDPGQTIGKDLICDLVTAKENYGPKSIIVDLGTATKFIVLNKNYEFADCLIIPGIGLQVESLFSNTSLLPDIDVRKPKSVLAHNTVDAIVDGVLYTHASLIDGTIHKIEKALGYKCNVILTGGYSSYIKDLLEVEVNYEPNLALDGLNILFKKVMQ